jgi:lipid A 3-O-deacylase
MTYRDVASIAAVFLCAQTAHANEVFAGVAAHEVDTPFTLKTRENGADVQLGWRGKRIEVLSIIGKPQPYVLGSLNTSGDTSFVAVGLSWTIGKTFYLRPAIGLALHDGPIPHLQNGRRTDLGSRVLFEPEIGVGYRLNEKVSVEANWTHISNATLFSGQNPGIDMIGIRLNIGI